MQEQVLEQAVFIIIGTNGSCCVVVVNEQNKLHSASNKIVTGASVSGAVSGALGLTSSKR